MLHAQAVAGHVGHRGQIERAARIEEGDAHADGETAHPLVHQRAAVGRGIDQQLAAEVERVHDVGLGRVSGT